MKTLSLIHDTIRGGLALGAGVIGIICDALATLLDYLGERCFQLATWLIE